MKDELTMLKEWIAEQREIYNNSNFENDEKKLEAIERQLTLNEVNLQITLFEQLSRENFIDNMPRKTFKERLCEEIKHQSKEKANGL